MPILIYEHVKGSIEDKTAHHIEAEPVEEVAHLRWPFG